MLNTFNRLVAYLIVLSVNVHVHVNVCTYIVQYATKCAKGQSTRFKC